MPTLSAESNREARIKEQAAKAAEDASKELELKMGNLRLLGELEARREAAAAERRRPAAPPPCVRPRGG